MKAIVYEDFQGPLYVRDLPDPAPPPDGVVLEVKCTGLCRSDWHGWMGHDPDVTLPHVPGHEMAGVVVEVGREVKTWKTGDRVTLPFVCGCGSCAPCLEGNQQVCDQQFQAGFTHWGSFAQYVALKYAEINLVLLPPWMEFTAAAALGCRFATSFRALVDQAKLQEDQWVLIYGCGGVGLSAVMIAQALGGRVIAVDIRKDRLEMAASLGAEITLFGKEVMDIPSAVRDHTGSGAHFAIDAVGDPQVVLNCLQGLRKGGKHVQIGLLDPARRQTPVPMDLIIARELELCGSHGMQAHRYPAMLRMIEQGHLHPDKLIARTIRLDQATEALPSMNEFRDPGITMITSFT